MCVSVCGGVVSKRKNVRGLYGCESVRDCVCMHECMYVCVLYLVLSYRVVVLFCFFFLGNYITERERM